MLLLMYMSSFLCLSRLNERIPGFSPIGDDNNVNSLYNDANLDSAKAFENESQKYCQQAFKKDRFVENLW